MSGSAGILCPWCGLASADASCCEWCGKDIPERNTSSVGLDPDDSSDQGIFYYLDPFPVRLERFLSIALPLIAIEMAVVRAIHLPAWLGVSIVSFCVCFVLSVYQVVESVDTQYAPVGVAVPFQAIFGPYIVGGMFLLGLLFTRKPEAGTALGLMITHFLTALLVAYAVTPEFDLALKNAGWVFGPDAVNLNFTAGVAGWAMANFWRPLNEA